MTNTTKKTDKTFIVLRGVPGSGKSEIADMMAMMHGDAVVVTTDDYWTEERPFNRCLLGQSHEWAFCQAGRAFEEGVPLVILANTSTQEWEFDKYVELAKVEGYRVYFLVVENRHGGMNSHKVPEKIVHNMERRFELQLYRDNKVLRPEGISGRIKQRLEKNLLWRMIKTSFR